MDPRDVISLRERLREQVQRLVVGQGAAADLLLVALLVRGHVLLHGVPGVAKTLLARTFAACLSLKFGRIQFTPDLMPGDVLGTNLFDFRTNAFTLTKGPIFTEVLLADEINRAPPKTQAALLQAMQERQVTLDGKTHDLGPGFLVIATQNPLEQEGTYPLPEAQLDRFLFRVDLPYPARDEEREIVTRHGRGTGMPGPEAAGITSVADLAALEELRATVASVRMEPQVVDYVVDLVRATRETPTLACGASPRAATMLSAAARALAALEGRDFAIPDDVKRLAVPTLAHRVVLAPSSEIEGLDAVRAVRGLLEQVAAPR
jgi:MoxR-like ATPase